MSLIKNKALINEEVDPVIIIKKLKAELLKAKDEIAFLKVSRRETWKVELFTLLLYRVRRERAR